MSMGQQLGSMPKPGPAASMLPGKPAANQLQQAMMPQGSMMGPVAPGALSGLQSSSGQFRAGMQAPVAPQTGYGMPVQTMANAVKNSQQNFNTNIQQPGRRR
jgi:hypothetical protein